MIAVVKAIGGVLFDRPWLLLVAIIGAQALTIHFRTSERDMLRAWQDDVTEAVRDAADRPKLAKWGVARQVRYLGEGFDKVRLGMAQAQADALAAKSAREAADETNRKEFDNALAAALSGAMRHGDDYARANGVRSAAGRPAGADRGDDGGADLPGSAQAAQVADRSGAGPALVSIPREAFDTCTALKVRLDNGHDWAVGARP